MKRIAILTSGKLISEDLGIKLENVRIEDLGRAKRVVVDKENTTIVEGAGKKKEIEAYQQRVEKALHEQSRREKVLEQRVDALAARDYRANESADRGAGWRARWQAGRRPPGKARHDVPHRA